MNVPGFCVRNRARLRCELLLFYQFVKGIGLQVKASSRWIHALQQIIHLQRTKALQYYAQNVDRLTFK